MKKTERAALRAPVGEVAGVEAAGELREFEAVDKLREDVTQG